MIKAQQQLLQVSSVGRQALPHITEPATASGGSPLHVTEPGRLLLLHLQESIDVTLPSQLSSALAVGPHPFLTWPLLYHGKQHMGKPVLTGLLSPHNVCPWPH